jgi:hypothetical protein
MTLNFTLIKFSFTGHPRFPSAHLAKLGIFLGRLDVPKFFCEFFRFNLDVSEAVGADTVEGTGVALPGQFGEAARECSRSDG